MRKKRGNSLYRFCLGLFSMMLLFCPAITGKAGTIYESPYVTWTPDHSAWTVREVPPYTDLWLNYKKSGTKPEYWYPKGETYSTGIESAIGTPDKGQHLYTYERHGEVPVGKWVCEWSDGRCIHPSKLTEFGGFKLTPGMCGNAYYSGWMGYCADCDACVKPALMYMSRDAVKSLTSIDVDRKWAYICPHCNNLENALSEDVYHTCKKISWNQYLVHYNSNVPGEREQDAEESIHMYNNAEEYEGYPVTAVRRLNANIFTRDGYTFAGWSLTPTGPVVYEDKAEIFNLCDYDWNEDRARGTVTLYAQWTETRSTLKINPAGGSYEGKSTVTSLEKGFGETYVADPTKIIAPKGYRISFNTQGGNSIPSITGKKEFFCWRLSYPFAGKFVEATNTYSYYGTMGAVDTLTADYVDKPIILPTPSKSDENFGGWYEDAACTIPAGFGGEEYVPSRDITLYASWADLTLYSTNNMSANDKKGAVDLRWAQKDAENKTYLMYQSEDNESFKQIFTASEVAGRNNVDKSFAYKGARETYTVQYSGLYTLSASGAQGGDYGSFTGGKGGSISGKFYLQKGDVLTIHVGGQNGYNGGGRASTYGAGGGATTITSAQKGVLLVAGGGGGASLRGDGGDGGMTTSLTDTALSGESGMAGGGGGYLGGHAGTVIFHTHSSACGQHTHKGNPVTGGLCYLNENVVEKECKVTTSRETWVTEWPCLVCGNNHFRCWGWVGHHSVCNDWSDCKCMEAICTACGAVGNDTHPELWGETNYYTRTHTVRTKVGYSLSCTIPEGFLCGKTEATVESSSAGFGGSSGAGSSAVNVSNTPGDRSGNGVASISAQTVGFTTGLFIDGVKAQDKDAPDKIDIEKVKTEALNASTVRLSFEVPKDNGTVYYHRVESYTADGNRKLLTSNTTRNLLTSGVAGFYYVLDEVESHGSHFVTKTNAHNAGSLLRTTTVNVAATQEVQYLHLAAVDVAGNVGETIDIEIERGELAWPIATDRIQITDVVGGRSIGSVYAKPGVSRTYYVCANGVNPFILAYNSYMDGVARADYQIDVQSFSVAFDTHGTAQNLTTKLPYTSPIGATGALPVAAFSRMSRGDIILRDAANTGASRSNQSRTNLFYQAFTIPSAHSGKTIVVTPVAGATNDEEVSYSVWSQDCNNAITLIADGEAPIVVGADILEGYEVINRDEHIPNLTITASDALSGLKDLTVTVVNLDNGRTVTYTPDAEGEIQIDFGSDEVLFSGDIQVTVKAVDNVGNEYVKEYGTCEFSLEANITNATDSTSNVCKRGELAILHILAFGYADKIEVDLPDELLAGNEDVPLVFHYDFPDYITEESLILRVPLDCPADTYTAYVHAYKNGVELTVTPALLTVLDGSVMSDVRVRIR